MKIVYLSGFSCWCWSVIIKIVYLVPVRFQMLVVECYNENCLPIQFQLLVLQCSTLQTH